MKNCRKFFVSMLLALCTVLATGCSGTANRNTDLPEVRNNGTAIQWKYTNETEWHDLVTLAELMGAMGEKGVDGINGKDGLDGKDGVDGEPLRYKEPIPTYNGVTRVENGRTLLLSLIFRDPPDKAVRTA